jgi:hypothetical protein
MPKHIAITLFLAMALAFAGAAARLQSAWAFDPSFPTRTPTPGAGEPPNPTATSADPGNPPPAPTQTTAPGSTIPAPTGTNVASGTVVATATAMPTVSLGGTVRVNPGGAGECSDTPYIRAIERLIVYGGPGEDFGPVATLDAEEMRPITGRAGFAQWWQIQIKPNMLGWVTDTEVDEFGNTALVPVVSPPAINGATPTPGTPWNPTPLPLLTCVPTPTPTATPTSTATPAAAESAGDSGGAAVANPPGGENAAGMVLAEIEATAIMVNEEAQASPPEQDSAPGTGLTSRGSGASRTAAPTSMTNLLLPLAGLALIAGGIVLALLSRNRGGQKAGQSE